MRMLSIIVAADENGGIGNNNQLLCHLPADMKMFKETTSGHAVIMGRKTWESLKVQPLPNRRNIVVTSQLAFKFEGVEVVHSVEEAVNLVASESEAFVIGGDSIYRQFLPHTQKIYLTRIHSSFRADTFFPNLDDALWLTKKADHRTADDKNKFDYTFFVMERGA